MKISEYPLKKILTPDTLLLIDSVAETNSIRFEDFVTEIFDQKVQSRDDLFDFLDPIATLEDRKTTFRGKNLGSKITTEQFAAIKDGSFRDLWLGDYWAIPHPTTNVINQWRVVDFDYWFGANRDSLTVDEHHVDLVPDRILGQRRLYSDASTKNGWLGTELWKNWEAWIEKDAQFDFIPQDCRINHTIPYVNAVDDNGVSGAAVLTTLKITMLTSWMVFGALPASGASYYTKDTSLYFSPFNYSQLQLFALMPSFMYAAASMHYWLAEPSSTTQFAFVSGYRHADRTVANNSSIGIRVEVPVTGGN